MDGIGSLARADPQIEGGILVSTKRGIHDITAAPRGDRSGACAQVSAGVPMLLSALAVEGALLLRLMRP